MRTTNKKRITRLETGVTTPVIADLRVMEDVVLGLSLPRFLPFLSEIGLKPSPAHSLDRINVNGHYECGNIRWATRAEQACNKRTRPRSGESYVYPNSKSWMVKIERLGTQIYGGTFANKADAVKARNRLLVEVG